jgi:hypothetical protein
MAEASHWEWTEDMKPKYEEGPRAKEKFERTMIALFHVQKTELAEKIKKKPKKGKD